MPRADSSQSSVRTPGSPAAVGTTRAKAPRLPRGEDHGALLLLERLGLVLALVVLIVVFTILRPGTFPTLVNWQSILVSQSVIAAGALAIVVPLTGGRFDISVGANLGMCSIACAAMMSKASAPLLLAILVALALGTAVGIANGIVIAYLGVNSLITTLGTATILGGLVQLYTSGVPISDGISATLTQLSVDSIVYVPELFVVVLLAGVVVWYVLTQTPYGRRLAAVGDNPAAAKLVGIRVKRTVVASFALSGTLAGVAGVLAVAQLGNANPQVGGVEFILPALAAAFLGATVFTPGQYNVPGTLVGLLFVGTAISGLALLGVDPWVNQVFNGGAIIVAVALSHYFHRRRTGETEVGG